MRLEDSHLPAPHTFEVTHRSSASVRVLCRRLAPFCLTGASTFRKATFDATDASFHAAPGALHRVIANTWRHSANGRESGRRRRYTFVVGVLKVDNAVAVSNQDSMMESFHAGLLEPSLLARTRRRTGSPSWVPSRRP